VLISKNTIKKILILGFVIVLATCGGGGGDVPQAAAEIKVGTITGIASLGPIVDGDVTAYNFSTGSQGDILDTATTKTADDGVYTIPLKIKNTPILICIKNGSYTEAASLSSKPVDFNTLDKLCAVANYQTSVPQNISITYYTHIAYGFASSLIKQGVGVTSAINQANTAMSTWIGTDIISTLPIDITNSASIGDLTSRHKYGFANAGLSSLIKELETSIGVTTEYSSITSIAFSQVAFTDVSNDGRLNGKSDTGIVKIANISLTENHYRTRLAQNALAMASSARNQSQITNNNAKLLEYINALTGYSDGVFKPITGPTIQITSSNELSVITGSVTFSATITDSVALKSVKFSLISSGGTVMPALPVPSNLNNAVVTFDTSVNNTYPDGQYKLKIDAININDFASTLEKANLNINNSGVSGVNIAPIAKPDTFKLTLGGSTPTIMVLSNDNDPDSGPNPLLEVVLDSPSPTAKGATITVNAAKTGIIYTESATMAVNDVDVFSYHAFDGADVSATVTVTVTATNQANRKPTANSLTTTATVGTQKDINLTAYINDLDGDPLFIVIDAPPTLANGTLSGDILFTSPDRNILTFIPFIEGVTIFTYHVDDGRGGASQPATVTINVAPAPNKPAVADPITINAVVGGADVIKTVTSNDSDGPSPFTVVRISSPTRGTLNITGRVLTYSPFKTNNTVGTDNFKIALNDGAGNGPTLTVFVTLAANQSPIVGNINPISVDIGGNRQTRNITVSDPDGPTTLTTTISRNVNSIFGFASINGMQISYQPPSSGEATLTSFDVTISDGVSTPTVRVVNVELTVVPIANDTPIVSITSPTSPNNFWYKSSANINIVGNVTDNVLGISRLQQRFGNAIYTDVPVNSRPVGTPTRLDFNFNTGLIVPSDGVYTYTLLATDAGQKTSTDVVTQIRIDTTPPTIALNLPGATTGIPAAIVGSPTVIPATSAAFGFTATIVDPGFPNTGSGILSASYAVVNATATGSSTPTATLPVANGEVSVPLAAVYEFTIGQKVLSAVNFTGIVEKQELWTVQAFCPNGSNYSVVPSNVDALGNINLSISYSLNGATTYSTRPTAADALYDYSTLPSCWTFYSGLGGTFYSIYSPGRIQYTWVRNTADIAKDTFKLSAMNFPVIPTAAQRTSYGSVQINAKDRTDGGGLPVSTTWCMKAVSTNNYSQSIAYSAGTYVRATATTGAKLTAGQETFLDGLVYILSTPTVSIAPATIGTGCATPTPDPATGGNGSTVACRITSAPLNQNFTTASGIFDKFGVTYSASQTTTCP